MGRGRGGRALRGKLVISHFMLFVCRYSGYGGCSESESEWAEDRDGWSDRCNQYISIIIILGGQVKPAHQTSNKRKFIIFVWVYECVMRAFVCF